MKAHMRKDKDTIDEHEEEREEPTVVDLESDDSEASDILEVIEREAR